MASNHWSMLWSYLQDVKCVELLHKFAEVSGLPLVPMPWSVTICMTLKGRDIIQRWYPEDNWQDFKQESCVIRRQNEQWHNREHSCMKRQLTKQIREDFQKRSQALCVDQDKQFNMMMQHIRLKNQLAARRKINRNRERVRRECPTGELWFKQQMKDCRGKLRVDFKRKWSNRHNAVRKAHQQREPSKLNERYCQKHSDNPWAGKTLTEIQKQCRKHSKSVQDKVKKLERLVLHHNDCGTNAELPNETLVAELPWVPLPDCRTHSGLKPFATKKMASTEFLIPNTMFGQDGNNEQWVKTVLNHPAACVMNTDDSHSIVWDSGASMCISNDKADFEGEMKSMPNAKVDGINSHPEPEGFGTVRWTTLDTDSELRTFKLPAHCAPKARQKPLSTSTFSKICPHNEMKITPRSWTVKRNAKVKDKADVEVMTSPVNNLPMSICMRPNTVKKMALNFAADLFVTGQKNQNPSKSKKEPLRWHHCLGHIGSRTVQFPFQTGVLATTQAMQRLHKRAADVTLAKMPRCAACQFGKQTN